MHGRVIALAVLSALLVAGRGAAQQVHGDPLTVEVEGQIQAAAGTPAPSREALMRAARLEAVAEVARRMLAPAVYEAEQAKIRAALEPKAGSFVLTFRAGPAHQQVSPTLDDVVEYYQPVAATVDARRVRAFLSASGWAPLEATRPSIVLCVVPESGSGAGQGEAALEHLRRYVADELKAREFVLIEPGVRGGAPDCALGVLALARELGADTGVEMRVGWHAQPGGTGPRSTIAEVALSAQRTGDASELALGRFQGVGHHDASEEALGRALEAVQVQVVDNLVLQLSRNWQEIASADGPVELVLIDVTGLTQVLAVQAVVEKRLGAEQVELLELAPGTASLRVTAGLSPGALQDRLVAAVFDGFALEPVETSAGRVSLRIHERRPQPVPGSGQIDTQEPN